jgi:hypothetical protein
MNKPEPSYNELLRECAHLHRRIKELEEELALKSKKKIAKKPVNSTGDN